MIDRARLRALAEAATPGPWEAEIRDGCLFITAIDGNTSVAEVLGPPTHQVVAADATYIAAASPDTVLALLDALDEARRERDEARADQRRYCFLRAESNMMAPLCAVVWKRNGDRESSDWVNTINGLDLDRMVDAAIDALDGAKEPT